MEFTTLNYELAAPRQIVFGWGRRRDVGRLAQSLGRRALLVSGSAALTAQGLIGEIADQLRAEGVEPILLDTIAHEPEVADVDRLSAVARGHQAGSGDLVLGIGGGAGMDLAKAIAAMATNRESPTVRDYLENVGRDLKITRPPLPVLAMPTTAGTGAEATRNAVISSYDPPFKKSLRDLRILPQIALIDPELTVGVPPDVTAASGMDAITQLLESYISRKAQPIPQALAVQGLRMALPAIVAAVHDGAARAPRENMAHAALLSGLCLANSGLGIAHGVAAALGVLCRTPHGLACAVMLPAALRANREVRAEALAELSGAILPASVSRSREAAVDALIEAIENLCRQVGISPRLSSLGVRREQIPQLVQASRGSSMSGNPRELDDRELTDILEEML
jgi:alcohol dehydrogenase class IV